MELPVIALSTYLELCQSIAVILTPRESTHATNAPAGVQNFYQQVYLGNLRFTRLQCLQNISRRYPIFT